MIAVASWIWLDMLRRTRVGSKPAGKKVKQYDRCANFSTCGNTSEKSEMAFVWAMSSTTSKGKVRLLCKKCREE
jgi:hypothetical protein